MADVIVMLVLPQVHVVEQEVCVEDEGKDCTAEELLEGLAMLLRVVVEEIEDNHAMLIQNYGGQEMQEYTQHLHCSLRQHQDLLEDL